MGSNPPYDPVLCCAARICCSGTKARKATEKLLKSMGLDDANAAKVAESMEGKDLVFMPRAFSLAMRDLIASSREYQSNGDNGRAFDIDDKVPKEV